MGIKPIRVKNEEEFERLRDRIDKEVHHARDHWNLLKELEDSSEDYCREMYASKTFWYLTFIAHQDAVLSHLGRLYDDTNGALSLSGFLETVRDNRAFFSDDAFRERLKNNPHVESLVKDRPIDEAGLDVEISTVSKLDPLVKRLHLLRNKAIAHTDGDVVRRDAPAAHKRSLPPDEIEELLRRAANLTVKYSLYFGGSCYGDICAVDDFKATLRYVRKGLAVDDAEIKRQLDQLENISMPNADNV